MLKGFSAESVLITLNVWLQKHSEMSQYAEKALPEIKEAAHLRVPGAALSGRKSKQGLHHLSAVLPRRVFLLCGKKFLRQALHDGFK